MKRANASSNITRLVVGSVFLTLLLFWTNGVAHAQVSASITGRIEDPSGAAIPTASVTVTSLETGASRTVTTDDSGVYRVLSLPVGAYEVRVEKSGFNAVLQKGINLVVGQQAVVNLKMEVGEVQQEVTVTAEAALVNTTTASVSGLVGEKAVKELPLNGRSFDNLITLNAGAVNYTTNTNSSTSGSGIGNFFSVAGRRPTENLFLLNGVEYTGTSTISVTPGGVSGQLLGIDAVREFNVVTDSYAAEYGKRSGGQVSIVTQSGTNQIHGTAFEFLRNSKLDARNFFDQGSIPAFRRNQFGGAAGGPIRKDKTFIFGNYEGFRQRLGISSVTFVPDDNARKGLLPNAQGVPTPVANLNPAMLPFMAYWPEPNGPNLGSGIALSYSNPKQSIREDFGTTRFDQTISAKDSLSTSYTIDDGENLTPSTDPIFGVLTLLRSQVASLQEQHVFSPQTLNIFRFGYSRAWDHFDNPPLAPFSSSLEFIRGRGPGALNVGASSPNAVNSAVITPAGTSVVPNIRSARNLFTYSDDIQHVAGRHQLGFGVWFQRLWDNEDGTFTKTGRAQFASLPAFLQGTVTSFTGNPRFAVVGYRMLMGAWYAQDNITLRPNLTLRVGLRHEFTDGWNEVLGRVSNYIPDSNGVLKTEPLVGSVFTKNNAKRLFGPRVGLAWDPFGKGKTSIRAGFGIHYFLQDALAFQPDQNPPFSGVITFGQNASFPSLVPVDPSRPIPPTCGPGVPQPCATYAPDGLEPNFKTPSVQEWNFTIEQQITPNMSFRAAYVGSHGIHSLLNVDPNSIPKQICANAAGCTAGGVGSARSTVSQGTVYIPVGTRPNPYLANALFWLTEGKSSYNALQLDVTRRFSHGLQFRANYSWSKNLDLGSGQSSSQASNQPQMLMDRTDPMRDWGPAALDIGSQASISGGYELPFARGSAATGALAKVAGGWQVNWIVTLLSGFPYTPQVGSNQSGDGNARNPDRPSLNPAFSGPVTLGSPNGWYDPRAFVLPAAGTYGNIGRGTLRGPGLGELDLSFLKDTKLTERSKLQFRAEFFNILNRANFKSPNSVVFSAGAISPTAGIVTGTATTSRQIQFGLKLTF